MLTSCYCSTFCIVFVVKIARKIKNGAKLYCVLRIKSIDFDFGNFVNSGHQRLHDGLKIKEIIRLRMQSANDRSFLQVVQDPSCEAGLEKHRIRHRRL